MKKGNLVSFKDFWMKNFSFILSNFEWFWSDLKIHFYFDKIPKQILTDRIKVNKRPKTKGRREFSRLENSKFIPSSTFELFMRIMNVTMRWRNFMKDGFQGREICQQIFSCHLKFSFSLASTQLWCLKK